MRKCSFSFTFLNETFSSSSKLAIQRSIVIEIENKNMKLNKILLHACLNISKTCCVHFAIHNSISYFVLFKEISIYSRINNN